MQENSLGFLGNKMKNNVEAVVLAAGKGVRMKSELPKVMHKVMGRPMVHHVVDALRAVGVKRVGVIVGYGKHHVIDSFNDPDIFFVEQDQQLGTGHAVQCYARQAGQPPESLLVVCGDTPLISRISLAEMIEIHRANKLAITMLTLDMAEPADYGRIIRGQDGNVVSIREAKDCSPEQLGIKEVNLAVYLFDGKLLFDKVSSISNNNRQKEYYLTDLVEMAAASGGKVVAIKEVDEVSTLGINSPEDLERVNEIMQNRAKGCKQEKFHAGTGRSS